MDNHYITLGIKPDATPDQIKKAYFEKAKKYHPDAGEETEISKFYELTAAYKTLSDPLAKRAYDLSLTDVFEKKKDHEFRYSFREEHRDEKRPEYRENELRQFNRNRFRKALWRVLYGVFFLALIGWMVAPILGGSTLFGAVSGGSIGLSFLVLKNFDLHSFFPTSKGYRFAIMATWLLFLEGSIYFIGLLVGRFV